MNRHFRLAVFPLLLLFAEPVAAATIDFETIPGSAPVQGMVISDQFEGITFSVSEGSSFNVYQYGSGYESHVAWTLQPSGVANTLVDGVDHGAWFAQYDAPGTPGRFLTIDLDSPASSVAFNLLDVDFGNGGPDPQERWEVRAYDALGALLGSVALEAGDPGTGDGLATLVAIGGFGGPVIRRVELDSTTDSPGGNGGGWGLDDLVIVPEPSVALLACPLLIACAMRRRRLPVPTAHEREATENAS